jgi:hypothetical protein
VTFDFAPYVCADTICERRAIDAGDTRGHGASSENRCVHLLDEATILAWTRGALDNRTESMRVLINTPTA